jgi:hypothetical protein
METVGHAVGQAFHAPAIEHGVAATRQPGSQTISAISSAFSHYDSSTE